MVSVCSASIAFSSGVVLVVTDSYAVAECMTSIQFSILLLSLLAAEVLGIL